MGHSMDTMVGEKQTPSGNPYTAKPKAVPKPPTQPQGADSQRWTKVQNNRTKSQAKAPPQTKEAWFEFSFDGLILSQAREWTESRDENDATAKKYMSAIVNGLKSVDSMAAPLMI